MEIQFIYSIWKCALLPYTASKFAYIRIKRYSQLIRTYLYSHFTQSLTRRILTKNAQYVCSWTCLTIQRNKRNCFLKPHQRQKKKNKMLLILRGDLMLWNRNSAMPFPCICSNLLLPVLVMTQFSCSFLKETIA